MKKRTKDSSPQADNRAAKKRPALPPDRALKKMGDWGEPCVQINIDAPTARAFVAMKKNKGRVTPAQARLIRAAMKREA